MLKWFVFSGFHCCSQELETVEVVPHALSAVVQSKGHTISGILRCMKDHDGH